MLDSVFDCIHFAPLRIGESVIYRSVSKHVALDQGQLGHDIQLHRQPECATSGRQCCAAKWPFMRVLGNECRIVRYSRHSVKPLLT